MDWGLGKQLEVAWFHFQKITSACRRSCVIVILDHEQPAVMQRFATRPGETRYDTSDRDPTCKF